LATFRIIFKTSGLIKEKVVAAVSTLGTKWTARLNIKAGYTLQLLLDILIVLLLLKLLFCFISGFGGKGFGSIPQDDDKRQGIFVFV
jgi:hypothetical protein